MNIVPDVKLDVRGEKCPYPRIRTLQQIKTLKKGEILEVIASDPEAWQNIDVWLTKSGDEFLNVETKEGAYHIFVRKG
ncbi:MAG TPA: sulfurtransferase TusA family protein [Candidatus Methanoperedens sp.]|jgi:TusA-related sulfurtransferase